MTTTEPHNTPTPDAQPCTNCVDTVVMDNQPMTCGRCGQPLAHATTSP